MRRPTGCANTSGPVAKIWSMVEVKPGERYLIHDTPDVFEAIVIRRLPAMVIPEGGGDTYEPQWLVETDNGEKRAVLEVAIRPLEPAE
jgi:hypothetical protein